MYDQDGFRSERMMCTLYENGRPYLSDSVGVGCKAPKTMVGTTLVGQLPAGESAELVYAVLSKKT